MSELEPTVFIVDGDTEVQQVLTRLLASVRLRVETFSTARAFLDRYDPSQAGCLILEVRIRDMSGIELCRSLRRKGLTIPIIFLTAHGDVPMAVQAMREGAFHFLEKPFNEQYLLDQTQAAVTLDLRNRRQERDRQAAIIHFESLSAREREVLQDIVAGQTNKQMAHHFGVAIKTVEFHRANVMKKIGARSVVELVCLLLKSGWNPAPEDRDAR